MGGGRPGRHRGAHAGAAAQDVPVVRLGGVRADAAVHAWDIALATGRPSPLTPELARLLLRIAREIREIVEPLRPRGAYVAALAPEQGDTDVAVLLRHLGRDPRWIAPQAPRPLRGD